MLCYACIGSVCVEGRLDPTSGLGEVLENESDRFELGLELMNSGVPVAEPHLCGPLLISLAKKLMV